MIKRLYSFEELCFETMRKFSSVESKSKGSVHKMIQISGRILSKNYNLKLETFFFRSAHRMI